jgi:hypothetical protein
LKILFQLIENDSRAASTFSFDRSDAAAVELFESFLLLFLEKSVIIELLILLIFRLVRIFFNKYIVWSLHRSRETKVLILGEPTMILFGST